MVAQQPMSDEQTIWSHSASKARWLLLSDIHFKVHDLDRIIKTSQWIASLPQRYNIQRAIICGDLLTARSTQPTHVLSACYRFLGQLSDQVPHLNVILGNHDLAYRREYTTTALDALDTHRLSKYVTLHSSVSQQVWDGRRVLVLPFREDQSELTAAVAGLPPQDAADTVGFAHLAIHKAILQRYVVNQVTGERTPCLAYKGYTGPGGFSPLARTFTGHFHSRQTIEQPPQDQLRSGNEDPLQGSITYIGAPLQMTWADLYDDQRGVTLLDPDTLETEVLVNPHAVGFVTADLENVLQDRVESAAVSDKHVMLLGERTQVQHVVARDKLLSLGARSVRNWNPIRASKQSEGPTVHGLGATALPGEAQIEEPSTEKELLPLNAPSEDSRSLDFPQLLESYFANVPLSKALEDRRMELIHVGRCLVGKTSNQENGDKLSYTDILDVAKTAGESSVSVHQKEPETSHIFVAKLRSLSLTNFLGVRETLAIDFHELPLSLTFITGPNGAGKSTLLEAIVWCQFGRCIRAGLGVNDVVNDAVGRGCEVTLTFENGYSITRYRKHKEHSHRVVVSLHGIPQPQFEKGDSRATQEAIEDLLGTDYDMYVRTVFLGSESAVGFLSSTSAQRRDLIESTLGLGELESQRELTRQMMREIDSEQTKLQSKQEGLKQVMAHIEGALATLKENHRGTLLQVANITRTIEQAQSTQLEAESRREQERELFSENVTDPEEGPYLAGKVDDVEEHINSVRRYLQSMKTTIRETEIAAIFRRERLVNGQARQEAEYRLSKATSELDNHRLLKPEAGWWRNLVRQYRNALGRARKGLENSLESHYLTTWTRFVAHVVRYLSKWAVVLENGLGKLESRAMNNGVAIQWHTKNRQLQAEVSGAKYRYDIATIKWRKAAKTVANRFDIPKRLVHRADRITADQIQLNREQYASSVNRLNDLMTEKSGWVNKQTKHQRQQEEDTRRKQEWEASQARSDAAFKERLQDLQRSRESKQELAAVCGTQRRRRRAGPRARALRVLGHGLLEEANQRRCDGRDDLPRLRARAEPRRGQHGGDRDPGEPVPGHAARARHGGGHAEASLRGHHQRRRRRREHRLFFPLPSDEDAKKGKKKKSSSSSSTSSSSSPRLLDSTSLGVTSSLAYAKRSGGERKRIDLALFFALVLVGQGRGAHRARYLLVDEVFDSLDPAGQDAVARWCRYLLARVDFVAVVTHSELLLRRAAAAEGARGEAGSRFGGRIRGRGDGFGYGGM
ncbi:uncharacterized protein PG998_014849 [Apiospora kogelbergensis]|uniref:uncharacterized protein n=1 Tax=Apiospora kogelbergensis TaxID=1337665 RepID=UPI00312E3E7A